jgi:CheY-like chemotaxis protein/anti-sigma regulatory factor (Ser/Thr protein kinase)
MTYEPRQPKLLLVDDKSQNLVALAATLEPLGLPMVQVQSGAEALRHVLSDDFAVILLDVQMPTMDGFETAQFIKQRERSRYIPIIFITAINEDERFLVQAYSSGAVDYIRKPFNPTILKSKVEVFVDLFLQREEIRRQSELLRASEQREAEMRQIVRERELMQEHALHVEELARKQRVFLREVLSSLSEGRLFLCDSPADLPSELPPFCDPVTLTTPTLRTLRRQVTLLGEEAGWPLERLQDFETAVGESAMNAVVHGKHAIGRVHVDRESGNAQVWIRDEGMGISEGSLHRATLEKGYTTAGTLGHGFWIMLKTADRIFLLTGPTGTTVVLEQGRVPPLPSWMVDV